MMKFSALNESSLSDDNGDPELATREAQEEEAYTLYHSALKKQSEGQVEESENMLKEILEMEFLTQAQPNDDDEEEEEEQKEDAPLRRPALTLKYLLYKNLANISNGKKDFRSAVAFFLEALEIDNTDVIMWYQMGKASLNISNYSLARLCFEEGLKCNPNHWPCLDNVITVMYTLNDYANCLYYIAKALERECYYLKGLAFKDEIYREDPSLKSFCESYFNKCDSSIHYVEYDKEDAKKFIQESLDMRIKKQSLYKPTPLPILTLNQPIKESTWKNLGESLVNMYECIKIATPSISYSCKIDLSPYLNNGNKGLEAAADKLASPSPVSSLSEACSSNSASPFVGPAAQTVQKPEGLLQLAPLPQGFQNRRSSIVETNPLEMDIDETPNASPYNLVLTPIEIQPTDLSICNDSTSSNRRTSKRKRLISEFTDLSAKRRSSRVRNPAVKKPQDNINYQELLQKFLPSKLIGDGKCDDPDDDSEPVSLDKASGDLSCGQSSENEKNDKNNLNSGDLSSSEKEEVSQFISSNQSNSGIIDLLYKYVVCLGRKSNCIWPKNLIDVFCEAFSRLRNHITTPNLFSQSADRDRIKEVSLAILCYCEFKVDKLYLSTGHSMSFSPKSSTGTSALHNGRSSIGDDFHSDMEFLVMLTVRRDVLQKEWLDFSARALWLKAKSHSLEGEIDLAVCCMGKLTDVLCEEDSIQITVQNCGFSNLITADKVQQQLESLQRCQSLEEVQRLYEHGDYTAVVDLLILTFNQPRTKRKQPLEGVPERHAQLLLLQNSLLKLERYKECVFWSEVSFNEALQQFMNAARSDWSETMAHLLSGLNNCAKLNSKYLSELDESKLVRLTQNLILVIVIQMENYDFSADNASLLIVLPWIILYRLILNEEKRSKSKKSSKQTTIETGSAGNSSNKTNANSFLSDFDLSSSMPSSLMLLFTAHEYLGRRSWCTFADGLLLLYCKDVMMAELQDTTGNSYLYREDLETGLEQCIYCLYGHPNKRTRAKHLQEHNSKQIPLTWEKAVLIFQYFKPNVLPEFDSYRTSTVSAELESLLKRIAALVPPEEDPTTRVDSYTAYIEGVTEKCPEPPFKDKTPSIIVKDLYYLLGDYYFKNKEFSKAIRFYLMDICVNPDRQDSWAGMALSRSSQLDQKLNSYELRNETTIYRKSSAALKCFEHALELDPTTTSLWIEHGSLAYILHSHASRQLKQELLIQDDLYELLTKKKLEMLQVAEKCFRGANHCDDGGEPEEAWLHHYMLGKICEKKSEGPGIYLDHYQKALMYLHEDYARYPQKIQYHNPLELSIEALEVYYRVHASCLKFLWKHEDEGVDLATLKVIKQCLMAIAMSPFANYQEKCKKEISCSSSPGSEIEDYTIDHSISVVAPRNVDHNYFGDVEKVPQKITDERRQSRPSIDSSPDTRDSGGVKEVMESLVGVVTERFIDEEVERSNVLIAAAATSKKDSKIIVVSVGEESVYTTKLPSAIESKEPIIGTVKSSKQKAYSKLKVVVEKKEIKTQENSECGKIMEENILVPNSPQAATVKEQDEFTKMQELALELETEAAASLLVEEMRLESNALGDMDYCNYDMYPVPPKQEDQDSAYYDCMEFTEDNENSVQQTMEMCDDEVLLVMSDMLNNLKEEEVLSSVNEPQQDKTVEMKTNIPTKEKMEEHISFEDSGEVSELVDSKIMVETEDLNMDKDEKVEMIVVGEEGSDKKSAADICTDMIQISEDKHPNESPESSTTCDVEAEKRTDDVFVNSDEDFKVLPSTLTEDTEESNGHLLKKNFEDETKEVMQDRNELKILNTKEAVFLPEKGPEIASKEKTNDTKESQDTRNVEKAAGAEKSSGRKVTASATKAPKVIAPPTPEELKYSQGEIAALIPLCMDALRDCLQRFIQHYKSLYRMAHYYCHSTKNKNLQWAREILLAATPPTKKYSAMPGLFADRKNTNLFNGIWRAPSNEIDRPGSFGSHMHRSVALLIKVLTQQRDYNMLVYLTQQLYRTPDLGKKYMRDTDRTYLVRSAYDCCVKILRDQLDSLLQEEPPPEENRLICCLLEIYRSCQTLLKSGIYVEETNDLLENAYTMYRMGEVDSHPSVLEQATKFCQLQLGKSYPQSVYEPSKSSSKYMGVSDPSENLTNTSMSSVNAYTPDAWQKEFAKSLMMPILPCKTGTKPEIKTIQDPVILIPIDSSKFSSHLLPSSSSNQCSVVATQMVHVEKPKAENLQACSVAFLPVTPVFSKETGNIPNTISGTSLLSCQAFECFDVLKTIMQASGYKVAPQTIVQHQDQDGTSPVNLVKPKTDFQCAPSTSQAKASVGRPRKRKRKAASQKMEALNLCKRISTKPIVSSSIAHSIAEIKVDSLVRKPSKMSTTGVTKISSFSALIPNVNDNSCSKTLITTPLSDETDFCKDSVSIGVNEATDLSPRNKSEYIDKINSSFVSSSEVENVSEYLVCNETNDDSSMSTNIDTSVIEQCAREMLEFINKRVEDMVLNTNPAIDFSSFKVGVSEHIIKITENKIENEKDFLNTKLSIDFSSVKVVKDKQEIENLDDKFADAVLNAKPNVDFSNINMGAVEQVVENLEDKITVLNTDVVSRCEETSEYAGDILENKIIAIRKDIGSGIEDNSDTLDADIKEELSDLETKGRAETFPDLKTFENKLEPLKNDEEIPLLESSELSRDSSTEFAVCSPKIPELEEQKEDHSIK